MLLNDGSFGVNIPIFIELTASSSSSLQSSFNVRRNAAKLTAKPGNEKKMKGEKV